MTANSLTLTDMLPKGRGDLEVQHGSRRAAVRWPFHTRIMLRHEDAAKDASGTEIFGVVLNMSAGGFRAVIPKGIDGSELDTFDTVPLRENLPSRDRDESVTQELDLRDLQENEFDTWASTDPGMMTLNKGDRFRTKIEAGDGTVVGTESAEIVWLRDQKDGYLVGLRFVTPKMAY